MDAELGMAADRAAGTGGSIRSGRRRLLVVVLAGVAALAMLASSAPSSGAADLQMGFGVSLLKGGTDRDWLRLGDPNQWETVANEYLAPEQARWVNIRGPWSALACDYGGDCSLYSRLRRWVETAVIPPPGSTLQCRKKVLLSIKWIAPPGLKQADTDLPGWGDVKGPGAVESMRKTAKNVYNVLQGAPDPVGDYPGGGAGAVDLTPCVQLEIAPEPNFEGHQGAAIQRADARLWWDAVNNTAFASKSPDDAATRWTFGEGIVAGGVSTNRQDGGWGKNTVAPYDYLVEAIDGAGHTSDPWVHRDQPYVDAYGIHTSHCVINRADGSSESTQETKWGCDQGIDDRVSAVHRALLETTNAFPAKEMEITALLPSETNTPGANSTPPPVSQADQEGQTTYIWNQLRTTVAGYDHNPLDLVVFNHLIDTGQGGGEGFPTAGFMRCKDGGAWDASTVDDTPGYCFPWVGKTVFNTAKTNAWPRTIP
jgi:hypothetical protein